MAYLLSHRHNPQRNASLGLHRAHPRLGLPNGSATGSNASLEPWRRAARVDIFLKLVRLGPVLNLLANLFPTLKLVHCDVTAILCLTSRPHAEVTLPIHQNVH